MQKPAAIAAALLGIACCALVFGPSLRLSWNGANDFVNFYEGGRLAGTHDLYNPDRIRAVQLEATGTYTTNKPYSRLPYIALLVAPLARLPYVTAAHIWEILCLASIVAFALLWPIGDRSATVLACCWSLPLFGALAQGQDVGFLLVFIAVTIRLMRAERPFTAGVVLSLCAAKYHLFALLPLLILGRRLWRLAAGLATGGAILLVLCTIAGGPHWISDYIAYLRTPSASASEDAMISLYALVHNLPAGLAIEIAGTIAVTAAVWFSVVRGNLENALAAVAAGGVVIGRHTYLADCALLLPALLVTLRYCRGWMRTFALTLLTPVPWILSYFPTTIVIPRLAILVFVLTLPLVGQASWPVHRRKAAEAREAAP